MDTAGLQSALSGAGVSDFVEDNTFYSHLPGAVGVRGRLPAPDDKNFEAATAAVKSYVAAHRGAILLRMNFFGMAVDCPAIAAKARQDALIDAKNRAMEIAQSTGTELGAIVSVLEKNGCPPAGRLGGSYAVDTTSLAMRVPVQETVVYSTVKPH